MPYCMMEVGALSCGNLKGNHPDDSGKKEMRTKPLYKWTNAYKKGRRDRLISVITGEPTHLYISDYALAHHRDTCRPVRMNRAAGVV